mmetsp:Transcript_33698/g.53861  ORF Transcript_33698/g.53861 Transcript_33698/m.53861 type:complete len:161 (+) Transcript_33698:578-1060(+)
MVMLVTLGLMDGDIEGSMSRIAKRATVCTSGQMEPNMKAISHKADSMGEGSIHTSRVSISKVSGNVASAMRMLRCRDSDSKESSPRLVVVQCQNPATLLLRDSLLSHARRLQIEHATIYVQIHSLIFLYAEDVPLPATSKFGNLSDLARLYKRCVNDASI